MNMKKAGADILQKVREHVRNGNYILREHAIERQEQRRIRLPDVLRALELWETRTRKRHF